MAPSMKRQVQRVKDDAHRLLSPAAIERACVAAGHDWRVRELPPVVLIGLMMTQVLHTTSLRGALRAGHVDATPTAFCKAKGQLPLDVIQHLVSDLAGQACSVIDHCPPATPKLPGVGRVVMVDGSSASMPDTLGLQQAFGHPGNAKPGCGFPVMHLLALFDQSTGMIQDLLTHPNNTHDLAHTSKLHPMLEAGDLLLGDRGFSSYAHLALLLSENLHGVLRLHQRQITSFRPGRKAKRQLPKARRMNAPSSSFVKKLGRHDQIVDYHKPKNKPDWMTQEQYAQLPGAIRVRELRYKIERPGTRVREVTVVTTLLDPRKYPKSVIAGLYESRWEVETRLCEFKQTLGADVLRSKNEAGVLKDIWMHVLVYNLIRLLMLRQAKVRGCDPRRLSFIDARDVLRYTASQPTNRPIPELVYHKIRPGRDEPRVIKRRKDNYCYMTKPRETLRQNLGSKTVRA